MAEEPLFTQLTTEFLIRLKDGMLARGVADNGNYGGIFPALYEVEGRTLRRACGAVCPFCRRSNEGDRDVKAVQRYTHPRLVEALGEWYHPIRIREGASKQTLRDVPCAAGAIHSAFVFSQPETVASSERTQP